MTRTSFTILLVLLSSIGWSIDRAEHLRRMGSVYVKKNVAITKSKVITLQDIATFENIPANMMKDISSIKVAEFTNSESKATNEISFLNRELSHILRDELAKVQDKFKIRVMLKLPLRTTISREMDSFSEAAVKAKIISLLKRKCKDCEYEIVHLVLPKISESLKSAVWLLHSDSQIRGHFSIPVGFQTLSNKAQTFWISGKAIKKKKVPVANRRLQVGDRIRKEDFRMDMRDISFATDGTIPQEKLIGKKLRASIAVDQIIWTGQIEQKKAMRYGDQVQVIMGNKDWQIQTSAVAQEAGVIGDTIRLLNPKTRKYMSGKIVADKMVRIR